MQYAKVSWDLTNAVDFDSMCLKKSLKFCTSNQLPGEIEGDNPQMAFEGLAYRTLFNELEANRPITKLAWDLRARQ